MARGARVKVMQQSPIEGVDKKAMADIMGQFLGKKESIDKALALSKFNTLLLATQRIGKLVASFNRSILQKSLSQHGDQYAANQKEFANWVQDVETMVKTGEAAKSEGGMAMVEAYLAAKQSKQVSDCIHMCSKLSKYKKYIQSNEDMSDSFLKSSSTHSLQVFSFSNLDIKYLYVYAGLDLSAKRYIMLFLNMVYNAAYDIFQVVANPDIDIAKISEIVMATIAQTRKMIPRTDKAFRKIEESMSMFKDNFGDYYKDFITTKDPSVILTNFLSDCKSAHADNDTKTDIELARQFTRIASFFKQQLNGKIKDPQIAAVLDAIDENFKSLDIPGMDDDEDEDDEHNVDA